jgi:hypothetical protein
MTNTRIQQYAQNLGWTKLPNGPSIFQFTAAQFPGNNAFSAVDIKADATSLYVGIGNNSTVPMTSQILRMDPNTFAVQAVISLPPGAWINHMCLSPGKLWAGDLNLNNIYRIDLATNAVDLTIAAGNPIRGIVYGLGKIMAANQTAGTVQFYDAGTGAPVGAPVVVGSFPLYSDFDGVDFWQSVQNSGTVVRIDGTTLLPISTLATSAQQFGVFCDGSLVYALGTNICVIDIMSGTIVATWALAAGRGGHFMTKVRNELWYAQHVSGSIGVYDETGTIIRTIPCGSDTCALAFNGYDVFSIDYLAWTLRRHNVEHGM